MSAARPARRRGMAVPLVLAVVALAGTAVSIAAMQRRAFTRRLATSLVISELAQVAAAAIDEVAQGPELRDAFAEPAARDGLAAALRAAPNLAGILAPADPPELSFSPGATRGAWAADAQLEVGEVRARLLDYGPSSRWGRVRLLVEVSRVSAGKTIRRTFAEDRAVTLWEASGIGEAPLRLTVSSVPLRRHFW